MRPTRSTLGDVALAVALAAGGIATSLAWNSEAIAGPERSLDATGIALIIATAAATIGRRRWPVPTLAAATVFTSAYLVVGYPYGLILLSFALTVFGVARRVPLPMAALSALAALLVLTAHLFTNDAALAGFVGVIPASAWVVVPFALGATVRVTQEARARERADLVRQHVDDERLRVAQEVHDVVGHGLAAIKMQADVALHLLPKKPEQAEAALNAISRTSTEALDELRSTLAIVRRADAESPRAPAPGLDRLEDLRQRMTDAGVDIDLEVAGEPRPLSSAVDLAAYRVVQESLTNVLRHGRAKVATVRIGYDTGAVTLAISNPTGPVRGRDGGLGIPGMRERVTALGGEFAAGPTGEGFFEVRATIPTGGHA